MEKLNYSSLKKHLRSTLDHVIENDVTVIVNKSKGNVVLISLNEFNSMYETLYLLSTENNRNRLGEAINRDSSHQTNDISMT